MVAFIISASADRIYGEEDKEKDQGDYIWIS